MLKLIKLSFNDSDVDSISSWVGMFFTHQDEDVSVIVDFHVALEMSRADFESKSISDLIHSAKPLIDAKLKRIEI